MHVNDSTVKIGYLNMCLLLLDTEWKVVYLMFDAQLGLFRAQHAVINTQVESAATAAGSTVIHTVPGDGRT